MCSIMRLFLFSANVRRKVQTESRTSHLDLNSFALPRSLAPTLVGFTLHVACASRSVSTA